MVECLEKQQTGPLVKAVAVLMAVGLVNSDISKALGEKLEKIDAISGSRTTAEIVESIQVACGMTPEQRLNSLVTKAISVKAEILNQLGPSKEKNLVATEIIERRLGKPTQMIVTNNVTQHLGSDNEVKAQVDALQSRLRKLEDKRRLLLGNTIAA